MAVKLRQVARGAFVALFAAISACGHGLHVLHVACDPDGHRPHGGHRYLTHSHPGRHHVHDATCPGEETDDAAQSAVGTAGATGSDEECAVCRYFAQGQLAAIASPVGVSRPAAPPLALGHSSDREEFPLSPYAPRGPPPGSAAI